MWDFAYHVFFLFLELNIPLISCLLCEDCPLPCDVPGVCTTREKCFVRRDVNGIIYRGCADTERWKDLDLSHNGCSLQQYLGWNQTKALWCFCNTTLCNRKNIRDFGYGPQFISAIAENQTGIYYKSHTYNKTSTTTHTSESVDAKQGKDAANFRRQQLHSIFGINLKKKEFAKPQINLNFRLGYRSRHRKPFMKNPVSNSYSDTVGHGSGIGDHRNKQYIKTRTFVGKPAIPTNTKGPLNTNSNEKVSAHTKQRSNYPKPSSSFTEISNGENRLQINPVKTVKDIILTGDENKSNQNREDQYRHRSQTKRERIDKQNKMPEIYPIGNAQELNSQHSPITSQGNPISGSDRIKNSQQGSSISQQGQNREISNRNHLKSDGNVANPTANSIFSNNKTVLDILTPFITHHINHDNDELTDTSKHNSDHYIEDSNSQYSDVYIMIDGIFERKLPQIWPTGYKKPLDAKESNQDNERLLLKDKYIQDASSFSKDRVGPNEGLMVQPIYDNVDPVEEVMNKTNADTLNMMKEKDIITTTHIMRNDNVSSNMLNTTFKYNFLKNTTPNPFSYNDKIILTVKYQTESVTPGTTPKSFSKSIVHYQNKPVIPGTTPQSFRYNDKHIIKYQNKSVTSDVEKQVKTYFNTRDKSSIKNYPLSPTQIASSEKGDNNDTSHEGTNNKIPPKIEAVTFPYFDIGTMHNSKQNGSTQAVLTKATKLLNSAEDNEYTYNSISGSPARKLVIKITPLRPRFSKPVAIVHNVTKCGKVFQNFRDKCPEKYLYVPKYDACYMFSSTSNENFTKSQEICQSGKYNSDLIAIETYSEYECVSGWLRTFPDLMDGWQGWWSGGVYNSDIQHFVWSHDGHVIDKREQKWQPSLVVYPLDSTCIWFVPLSKFTLGNYWCNEPGGFVCEAKPKKS